MKKALALSTLALAMSFGVSAAEVKEDKHGFGLSVGYSTFVAGDLEELDGTPLTIGGNYTLKNGVLIGFDYTSKLIDDHFYSHNISSGIETSLFSPYIGVELENGFRVMGGIAFAMADATITINGQSFADDEVTAGLMAGLGYVSNKGVTVDGKFSFVEVGGFDGVVGTVSVGYKF